MSRSINWNFMGNLAIFISFRIYNWNFPLTIKIASQGYAQLRNIHSTYYNILWTLELNSISRILSHLWVDYFRGHLFTLFIYFLYTRHVSFSQSHMCTRPGEIRTLRALLMKWVIPLPTGYRLMWQSGCPKRGSNSRPLAIKPGALPLHHSASVPYGNGP